MAAAVAEYAIRATEVALVVLDATANPSGFGSGGVLECDMIAHEVPKAAHPKKGLGVAGRRGVLDDNVSHGHFAVDSIHSDFTNRCFNGNTVKNTVLLGRAQKLDILATRGAWDRFHAKIVRAGAFA